MHFCSSLRGMCQARPAANWLFARWDRYGTALAVGAAWGARRSVRTSPQRCLRRFCIACHTEPAGHLCGGGGGDEGAERPAQGPAARHQPLPRRFPGATARRGGAGAGGTAAAHARRRRAALRARVQRAGLAARRGAEPGGRSPAVRGRGGRGGSHPAVFYELLSLLCPAAWRPGRCCQHCALPAGTPLQLGLARCNGASHPVSLLLAPPNGSLHWPTPPAALSP